MIEQAKFTYSRLRKAFEKQTKAIEDRGQQQVDTLKAIEGKSNNKKLLSEDI